MGKSVAQQQQREFGSSAERNCDKALVAVASIGQELRHWSV